MVLAIPNPILFLIYLSHFPQFQVYLVLQQAFIRHLLYATNLIIGKDIFSPAGSSFTFWGQNHRVKNGCSEASKGQSLCSQTTRFYFKFNVKPLISFKEGGNMI